MAHIAGHLLTLTVREISAGLSPGVAGLYLLATIFEKSSCVFALRLQEDLFISTRWWRHRYELWRWEKFYLPIARDKTELLI